MSQEKDIGYVTLEIANILDVATSFQLPPWGKVIRANAYFLPS